MSIQTPRDEHDSGPLTQATFDALVAERPETAQALATWLASHGEHDRPLISPRVNLMWVKHEGAPEWSVFAYCRDCRLASAEFPGGAD